MNNFLTNNSALGKTLRTIVQGIIGVIIANIDVIIGTFAIPIEYKPMITALVMAVLSPVMAEIGKYTTVTPEETIEEVDTNGY